MIFVTGGAGFIGSNIVAGLEEAGYDDIVVCDWLGEDDKWRNIAKRNLANVVRPEEMFQFLGDHAGDIDAIIHMGAISSTTERDADLIMANNFRLTMDLWHWCSRNRVRLIYASSAATYGDGAHGFDDDPDEAALARLKPLNPYGWSKHLTDRRIMRLLASAARARRSGQG